MASASSNNPILDILGERSELRVSSGLRNRSGRHRSAEGWSDPRTIGRFFDSLADSFAQNDMYLGRNSLPQGDMC